MLKEGDHIIYHRGGIDYKCILISNNDDIFKVKFKVNYNLNIFVERIWDLILGENEYIILDHQLYRNIKLNTLLGRDETR